MEFDHCLNMDKCGEWKDKQFASLSYPVPNNDSSVEETNVLPPIPGLQAFPSLDAHRDHPYRDNRNHNTC